MLYQMKNHQTENLAGRPHQIAFPLSPDVELLLTSIQHCLRIHAPTFNDGAIFNDARPLDSIDWAALIATAERHRMLPILYWWLEQRSFEGVPESTVATVRQALSVRAIHRAMISLKIADIADAMHRSGIRVFFFKGPVLAAVAYPESWLRETRDIDMLVHRDDVDAARECLVDLGYREVWTSGIEDSMGLWNCINLYDGVAAIDLQWDDKGRSYFSPFDFDHIWSRRISLTLENATVQMLSNEDLLLLLCLHGNKHCWFTLSLIADVAALVSRRSDLDWNYVWSQAQQMEVKRTLSLGLYLAQTVLGLSLPHETQAEVAADPSISALSAQIYAWLFQRDDPLRPGEIFRFNFKMKASLRRRIHYLLHYFRVLITPNKGDETALALPPSLSFLYYVLRPFRLLNKHLLHR